MTIEDLVKKLLAIPIEDSADSINNAIKKSGLPTAIMKAHKNDIIAVSCPFWTYENNIEGSWMSPIYYEVEPNYATNYEELHRAITDGKLGGGKFNFLTYYCRERKRLPSIVEVEWTTSGSKTVIKIKEDRVSQQISNKLGAKKYLEDYKDNLQSINYLYFLSAKVMKPETRRDVSAGGFFILCTNRIKDEFLDEYYPLVNHLYSRISLASMNYRARREALKSAMQSILIDSYAHNISAHSLNFLQQLFTYRTKEFLQKNISLNSFIRFKDLPLNEIRYFDVFDANKKHVQNETSEDLKYYSSRDLSDSTNTIFYFNLLDYLLYNSKIVDNANNQLKYEAGSSGKLPMPLDYAIAPLLTYLRDKGAFWSGVIRNNEATPSKIINFYELLMELFDNPLFIGSIMAAEEFFIIHVFVHTEGYKEGVTLDEDDTYYTQGHLLTINLKAFIEAEMKANEWEEPTTWKYNYNGVQHTNLSFVRLSIEHKYLLDELKEIEVLLPGGDVGKHAFYTIVENTLRNAKHIKDEHRDAIKKEGLELHFTIKKDTFTDIKGTSNETDNLYEIGLFLNYQNDAIINPSKYSLRDIELNLLQTVVHNSFQSVLDKEGKPRMGGSMQDKVCAAALFNTRFTDVEYNDPKVENYYPWVYYNLLNDREKVDVNLINKNKFYESFSKHKRITIQELEFKDFNKYLDKTTLQGRTNYAKNLYVKFFYLWKGQEFFIFDKEVKAGTQSNFLYSIPRYKIGVIKIKDKTKANNTFEALRQQAVIRLIKDIETKYEFAEIYKKWNKEWLGKDETIILTKGGDKYFEIKSNDTSTTFTEIQSTQAKDKAIKLYHGEGAEASDVCKLRSHGYFLKCFFGLDLSTLFKKNNKKFQNIVLKQEFFETIFTKITIVDNRLFDLLFNYKFHDRENLKISHNQGVFAKHLNLWLFNEYENIVEVGTMNGEKDKIDNSVGNLKRHISETKNHFFIFHLSFVEKLGFKGAKINDFITEWFGFGVNDEGYLPKNTIICITTGRGRNEWLK